MQDSKSCPDSHDDMMTLQEKEEECWYAMRDLKRPNAKLPGYRLLKEAHFEVFTPMRQRPAVRQGRKTLEEVPVIQDLLFVRSTRDRLDPVVERTATLQYRYGRGNGYRNPIVVPRTDMERFIHAVSTSAHPVYYLPEEITPAMYGRRIRIIGGPLDGYEGGLVTTRGSRTRRLLVELPHFLAAGVEVSPDYIMLI